MIFGFLKQKVTLFIIFIVIILGIGVYYFLVYQKNQTSFKDPAQTAVLEAQNLVEKVGKLMELPSEQPQIATVSDISKLPGDQFFARAENGDKVLIYNIARKAILYRPSVNKIIDVAPLAVVKPTAEPVQVATVSATPTVIPTIIKKSLSPTLTPTVTQ